METDSRASRPAPTTCPGCQHAAHEGHCLQPVTPLGDLCFCGGYRASLSPEPTPPTCSCPDSDNAETCLRLQRREEFNRSLDYSACRCPCHTEPTAPTPEQMTAEEAFAHAAAHPTTPPFVVNFCNECYVDPSWKLTIDHPSPDRCYRCGKADGGAAPPSGAPESTSDDFFAILADLARQKDIIANGPNPIGVVRSTAHVTLTMNEILMAKARFEALSAPPTESEVRIQKVILERNQAVADFVVSQRESICHIRELGDLLAEANRTIVALIEERD